MSRFVRFLLDADPVAAVHVPLLLAGVLVIKRTSILGNSHVQRPPHSSISRLRLLDSIRLRTFDAPVYSHMPGSRKP